MIRRSDLTVNRKRLRGHIKALNFLHSYGIGTNKSVPRTIVVSKTNIFWETGFTKVYVRKRMVSLQSLSGFVFKEDKRSIFLQGW
ncbi:MAG: hypothetical protein QW478_12415 [Candidatus Micrarchaeaceae archaeon]